MRRGSYRHCKEGIYSCSGKPVKIVGISSGKRSLYSCAKEDPVSLYYLKLALKAAEAEGAKTQLIDLRDLRIGACKECYSSNPAQCRFDEKRFMCDCYPFKEDTFIFDNGYATMDRAYDIIGKKEFVEAIKSRSFSERDDMWIVYKAMMEADGVIFATATNYYSRPALLQIMFSRFTALDGGVEDLWGDGKNLGNSIRYSKNPKAKYKQRLYGRWCAFINCSKEGDSVSPDLMKACTMMGMRVIPLSVAYRVNWYSDPTHRSDTANSKKDPYTLALVDHIGHTIVKEVKNSYRKYGISSTTV